MNLKKSKDIADIDSDETIELIDFMKQLYLANELEIIEEPIISLRPTKLSLSRRKPLSTFKRKKIGVVSDIEGAIKNAEIASQLLAKKRVDAIIIAGDLYESFEFRNTPLYPRAKNKVTQMIRGITPFAKLGVPLFLIPGNHEKKTVYNDALHKLQKKYPHIIDLRNSFYSQDGIHIVGLGGYHSKDIMAVKGFYLTKKMYEKTIVKLKELQHFEEPIIFVTHSPPLTDTDLDVVHMVGHLGDPVLTEILASDLSNIIHIHGHIHEAGGKYVYFNDNVSINVASITDYSNPRGVNAGVITFTSKKIFYKELR